MKKFIALVIVTVALGGCGVCHDGLTYLQSDVSFCSNGERFIHNPDGTSTQVFGQNGKPVACSR